MNYLTKCYSYSSPNVSFVDEITGDHQCGFWCNRSTTDQIYCVRYWRRCGSVVGWYIS